MTNRRELEDAMYRFFRHIQDQVEQVDGWMQSDYYHPEIDVYEFNLFVNALGKPSNAARWHELHERNAAQPEQKP